MIKLKISEVNNENKFFIFFLKGIKKGGRVYLYKEELILEIVLIF